MNAVPAAPIWKPYPLRPRSTVTGDLRICEGFYSPELDNRRDLFCLLPPSYATGRKRYPVLYMNDGQNLFDADASYAGEWQVDETMQKDMENLLKYDFDPKSENAN